MLFSLRVRRGVLLSVTQLVRKLTFEDHSLGERVDQRVNRENNYPFCWLFFLLSLFVLTIFIIPVRFARTAIEISDTFSRLCNRSHYADNNLKMSACTNKMMNVLIARNCLWPIISKGLHRFNSEQDRRLQSSQTEKEIRRERLSYFSAISGDIA